MNLADYLNTYSNANTVDWSSIGPALQRLGIGQNGGGAGWQFNNSIESGNPGWTLSPESVEKLQGWTVGDPRLQEGDTRTRQIMDAGGGVAGASNEDVSQSMFWDKLMPAVVAGGMGYFAAPALGGALGGGLLGGAAGGAISGGAIAGATGNNVAQGALGGGLLGGISGAMGNVPATGDPMAGLDPFTPESLDAWGKGAGVGSPDWESAIQGAQSFPVAPQPEFQQATAPSWMDAVKGETEASLQQASQQTPQQVAATAPDVSQIPTVLPTTGLDPMRQQELAGYETNGSMPSSPAVPTGDGGLLGTLKAGGSSALDWMKANPALAKLMLGGASGLLAQQSGTSAPRQAVNPVQWQSPVQPMSKGLLGGQGGGQSAYPAAMGLMGGQKNAGAWRFLGG